jgi:hypothetical protein
MNRARARIEARKGFVKEPMSGRVPRFPPFVSGAWALRFPPFVRGGQGGSWAIAPSVVGSHQLQPDFVFEHVRRRIDFHMQRPPQGHPHRGAVWRRDLIFLAHDFSPGFTPNTFAREHVGVPARRD